MKLIILTKPLKYAIIIHCNFLSFKNQIKGIYKMKIISFIGWILIFSGTLACLWNIINKTSYMFGIMGFISTIFGIIIITICNAKQRPSDTDKIHL